MSIQDVKDRYGATHYLPMKDGVTPQMFYKQETVKYNDGITANRWVYLTHTGLWFGSGINGNPNEIAMLKEI